MKPRLAATVTGPGAVIDTQLGEDALQMSLDRVGGQLEARGDLLVGMSVCKLELIS
jgi:hypothetical protein